MRLLLPLLFLACQQEAQLPAQPATPAEELLQKAIAYHDPGGRWGSFHATFVLGHPDTGDTITIDLPGQYFAVAGGGNYYVADGTTCRYRYYDRKKQEQVAARDLALDTDACATVRRKRDYHTYLNGLPMKLADPGTPLEAEVVTAVFHGEEYLRLRVNYPKEGGTVETWEYFFDPQSYALSGYQFYRSDKPDGGEYLLLSGEETVGGIRMIKRKDWYLREDDRHLGADVILGETTGERY